MQSRKLRGTCRTRAKNNAGQEAKQGMQNMTKSPAGQAGQGLSRPEQRTMQSRKLRRTGRPGSRTRQSK
jgi:hypothetical protein